MILKGHPSRKKNLLIEHSEQNFKLTYKIILYKLHIAGNKWHQNTYYQYTVMQSVCNIFSPENMDFRALKVWVLGT